MEVIVRPKKTHSMNALTNETPDLTSAFVAMSAYLNSTKAIWLFTA